DGFRDYMQESEETALTSGMAETAGHLERLKQAALVGKLPMILAALRRMLDERADEKVVVFSHYREPIRAIAEELAPYGVVTLTGSTGAEARGEVVARFQKDPQVRVFVGQTVAAGVAITLTARPWTASTARRRRATWRSTSSSPRTPWRRTWPRCWRRRPP